ncbi:MAG: NTP transferase domain-containing protein [Flavonifractor plautii]
MKNGIKAVVLAAGKGTRLRTEGVDLPKVLRQAAGRPLLGYVLEELSFLEKEDVVLVVGYEREKVLAAYPEYPHAVQEPQQGTGHAVQCAREALAGFDGSVLVCYGDMPLMRRATYESLIETHKREGNDCTPLSAVSDEESPYGRIVRKSDGSFSHIVEDKDCTPEEKAIRELNVGVYVFESGPLWEAIDQLRPNNAQGSTTSPTPRPTSSPGVAGWGPAPPVPPRRCWGSTPWSRLAQVEELVRRREGLK